MNCIQEMKSLYINDSYKGKCYKWNTDDLLMYLYVDERVIAIPLKYDVSIKETDNRIDIKVCRNQPIGQSARDDLLALESKILSDYGPSTEQRQYWDFLGLLK